MNSQEYRNLQEAYLNVYQEIDEAFKPLPTEKLDNKIKKLAVSSDSDSGTRQGNIARVRSNIGKSQKTKSFGSTESAKRKSAKHHAKSYLRQHRYSTQDTEDKPDLYTRKTGYYIDRGEDAKKKHLQRMNKEQVDLYDIILSHLIDEGYADTQEAAEVMMVNMSEEWREEILDEGIGSAIKGLFAKKKEPEAQKPESRGAELRRRYNTGPEKSDTSVKRAIINRSRDNATRAQAQVDRGNASQSYADKAKGAVDSYLKAGYNKYGADRSDSGGMGGSGGSGRGNKARKRAAALNNSYDLFDYMMEYLISEGYADTNENALVIMANMSEEWKNSIIG